MHSKIWNFWWLAIAVAFASGCAQQTQVVKLYEEPSPTGQSYSRLLVVVIDSIPEQRRGFEQRIVANLKSAGVEATASGTLLDVTDGVLQEDLDRAGDEAGADAMLVTHIASVDREFEITKGREQFEEECRGGNPVDFFLYDYEVIKEPDSVKVAHTVIVIANLYDVGSRKRIWTIQSTCFDKRSMSEVLSEEANAIVRQLRNDKLI